MSSRFSRSEFPPLGIQSSNTPALEYPSPRKYLRTGIGGKGNYYKCFTDKETGITYAHPHPHQHHNQLIPRPLRSFFSSGISNDEKTKRRYLHYPFRIFVGIGNRIRTRQYLSKASTEDGDTASPLSDSKLMSKEEAARLRRRISEQLAKNKENKDVADKE